MPSPWVRPAPVPQADPQRGQKHAVGVAAGTAARRRWWVLLSALTAACAAALTAGVTFGTFSDAATSGTQLGIGTISIGLTRPGGPLTPLVASSFYPGDSVSQELTLSNDGTSTLGALRLTTSATPSSVLTTDAVNGLQLTVSLCSRRWTAGGTPAAPTYTCAGTSATLYSGPFVVDRALTGLDTLTTSRRQGPAPGDRRPSRLGGRPVPGPQRRAEHRLPGPAALGATAVSRRPVRTLRLLASRPAGHRRPPVRPVRPSFAEGIR